MWPSPLNASERTSEQALSCSLEGRSMSFLRLASLAISQLATLDLSMIAVALTPSWLVWIITVMPLWLYFLSFLFCSVLFLNSNFIYYTTVSCVWSLIPFVSLQTNWAWKPSNSDCPFRFLFKDCRLCSRYNNVNYGAWHVYKRLFGCSVATCRLACFEISLSINEKKLEKSPGKGRT